ncbi:hypothetical protein COCVIDRAFT_105717 [Bipolaris victoriae FI3]|uniref:Secreted protein n=1 Tax=Bipolaris victoriae (strain FI3) TaxID=930091 RepID=W7EFU2_BIPV3|nr:hypothetical protein COCVIDRAFT_105717 [Bipolaris victoriae FI3]
MCSPGRVFTLIVFAARKLNVTCVALPPCRMQLFLNHFTPPWLYPVNMHCCRSPCVPESSILFRCRILFLAATHASPCYKYTFQQPLLSVMARLL